MSEEEIVCDSPSEGRGEGGLVESPKAVSENAIFELRAQHANEIAVLKEQLESLRDVVKESLSQAVKEDGSDVSPSKTTGLKRLHTGIRSDLNAAASQAHETGNRTDVQEYLRLRRKYL